MHSLFITDAVEYCILHRVNLYFTIQLPGYAIPSTRLVSYFFIFLTYFKYKKTTKKLRFEVNCTLYHLIGISQITDLFKYLAGTSQKLGLNSIVTTEFFRVSGIALEYTGVHTFRQTR